MSKLPLIIDKPDTQLTQQSGVLEIKTPLHRETLPIRFLDSVVIYGKPMVSCDVWRAFSEHAIAVTLLPSRGKGEPAWMGGGLAVNTRWRQQQYAAFSSSITRLQIAKWVIEQKFAAQNAHLLMHGLAKLDSHTNNAKDLAQLMGYEGSSAKSYFQALGGQLHSGWAFNGRNRQPPKDPVNALLSLSYTLAVSEVKMAIEVAGLDPWLGFVHHTYPARPALALDLLEAFRPQIDQWIWQIIHEFEHDDFSVSDAEGCRLAKEARRSFYAKWHQQTQDWLGTEQTLRQLIKQYVETFKNQLALCLPIDTMEEMNHVSIDPTIPF
ncbi:CRISPR-associated endonuclease Cas1 [Thiomicrospira microaerophila]|uniref:CRISPR-associated endonuclease Cas1 n=1 Tax=Thiomicrospira microaerophila TaxID=406020 RepID=UPI0006969BCB|nr:CRISPR-associated endonuclease Cas1 [Thiomicrospira microaerophila]